MKTILRIVVGIMLTYGLLTMTSCSTNNSNDNDRETAKVRYQRKDPTRGRPHGGRKRGIASGAFGAE
jgi:hypothetical protein